MYLWFLKLQKHFFAKEDFVKMYLSESEYIWTCGGNYYPVSKVFVGKITI